MAIITVANAKRIIANSELKDLDLRGNIYKRPMFFFNKYEQTELLAIQEFLKNPENYFKEIYKPLARKADTFKYIYEGRKPAYHESAECPMVHADYENFVYWVRSPKKGLIVCSNFASGSAITTIYLIAPINFK